MRLYRLLKAGMKYLSSSEYRFNLRTRFGFNDNMPDEEFLKKQFYYRMGYELDLDHPKTFNEKLQWLKLHDRRPEYTMMVDKYAVKAYVAQKIGEQYVIPTLGVWEHFDEIDFDKLPNQFVLKCTHDSGGGTIVKDKSAMDIRAARKKLESHLCRNFYYAGREWPYKNVPPQIIAETYLKDDIHNDLMDYKIFCFDGKPKLIQVDFDRFTNHQRNLYSPEWEYVEGMIEYPTNPARQIPRPENLADMLRIASVLSQEIPHVRVDLYSVSGRTFFGELTFYHGAGFEKFVPFELGVQLGDWLKLPDAIS